MMLKIKKLHQDAKANRAYSSDAGLDLFADENTEIFWSETATVKTGIAVEIPEGYYGRIAERSSLGSKGIAVRGGVIDSGFLGEIKVVLHNLGRHRFEVRRGDKIAQLIVIPVCLEHEFVDELSESPRGDNGFGSTGA